MTNKHLDGIVGSDNEMSRMAVRPRLQIDMSPELNAALDDIVIEEIGKQRKKMTKRQVVLLALAYKYPRLAPMVEKELS